MEEIVANIGDTVDIVKTIKPLYNFKAAVARLVVEFPALCPSTIIKGHQMHLANEFSCWFQWTKEKKT